MNNLLLTNHAHIATQTFKTYAATKLLLLASALGLDAELPLVEKLLTALTLSWGDQVIGRVPQERETYLKAVTALTKRFLETTVGLHSYALFKRHKQQPLVTLYFAMEAYKVFPARLGAQP